MSDLNISSSSVPVSPPSQPDSSSISQAKAETSRTQDSIANASSYSVLPGSSSQQEKPINAMFAVIDILTALKIQLNVSDLIDIIAEAQFTNSSSSVLARKLASSLDEREQLLKQRNDLIKQLDNSDLEDEEKQNINNRLSATNNRLNTVEITIKNTMQELNLVPIEIQKNEKGDNPVNFEQIIRVLLLNLKTQDTVNLGDSSNKGMSQAEIINTISRLTAQEIVKESDFTLTANQVIEEVKKNKDQLKELIENAQIQTNLKNTNQRV